MLVEPKVLVRRLTPTATKCLEAAAARASQGQHYEITVEHMLLAMLQSDDGDVARILHHFGQDKARLLSRIEKIVERMRSGNGSRPAFSGTLFQWFEDSWTVSSLETDSPRLRTGSLFRQFVGAPAKYTGDTFPEVEAIPPDQLKKEFADVVAPSAENNDALPNLGGKPGEGGGAARAGGDENLKRFCSSFTDRARKGEIDPVFARHREIRQMIDILSRRRKNNPIIVGEPGVGKTALAEGLALAIVNGDVPDDLKNVDLLNLDLGILQAGASVKGEFENRLKGVIAEVKSSPRPVILFIDEAHNIVGAGQGGGGTDASNLLKPALARGELRTIAATTWAEYKKYFEKDAALERRFQPVKVDEPSEEDAAVMLRGLKPMYEKAHKVTIRDEAIVAAVKLSHRYISGRQLPDKAVDLLDTSAARVRVELGSKPDELVGLESNLAALEKTREAIVRDEKEGYKPDAKDFAELEGKIKSTQDKIASLKVRWETERGAVEALKKAREALNTPPAGANAEELKGAVTKAQAEVDKVRGEEPLIHADVDADVVARVVSSWTGIPAGKMRSDAIHTILQIEDKLRSRVKGQDHAIKTVAEVIRISYAGIRNPTTPIGVLLFVGPSGTGKTETALTLADQLYGGERFLTAINMSEFQEKHTVSRLIGSPPGYVGYGEGGVLTEAVRQRPYSVVLLDEVEKADLEVMNLFYQVFDKGVLNDGEGRTIDFKNTVMILTSNLASDLIMKAYEKDEPPNVDEVVAQIRPTLSKHFKPALLARMTIVPYAPISRSIMKEITQLKIGGLAQRLMTAHKITTNIDPEMINEIARRCTESETGARNIDMMMRGSLVPRVSRTLLERMATGTTPTHLELGIAPDGDWRVDFSD